MKKITVLFITFVMLFSTCQCIFANEASTKEAALELYSLGIFDEQITDFQSTLTRAEMTKAITRLVLKCGEVSPCITEFTDVSEEHQLSGYVSLACANGIISMNDAKIFEPDRPVLFEEAVKMMISALGYTEIADAKGAYPTGYLSVASAKGLLNDVSSKQGNMLSMKNVVNLLANSLSIPLAEYKYYGNDNVNMTFSKDNDDLLSRVYKVSVYKAYIEELKDGNSKMVVTINSVKSNNHLYSVGEQVSLIVSDKLKSIDCLYTYAEIMVNDDDELVSISVDSNIEIVKGYIDEINKEHIAGSSHNPRYINNIALNNQDEYFDVGDNCKFYFNGDLITSRAEAFTGSYGRLVLYKGEIMAVQAWSLTEGGIVTSVGDDSITYTKGERADLLLGDIESYNNCSIIINETNDIIWSVKSGMVFDYYADLNQDNLILVFTSRTITDVLTAKTNDKISLGTLTYSLPNDFRVYGSVNGDNYKTSNSMNDLLGMNVTAYLDYAGFVRYIRPTFEAKDKEFYGIVMGYEQEGLSEPKLSVYKLTKSSADKEQYILSKNCQRDYSNIINTMKTELANVFSSNKINDTIKDSELLYKFKINSKNEIINIQSALLFDASPTGGVTNLTIFQGTSYPYLISPRIYFDGAIICAFYYDGDIKVKAVAWDDIRNKQCSSIRLDFYADAKTSDIDIALLRGSVDTISSRDDSKKYGLITDMSDVIDKTNGETVKKIKISPEKSEFTMTTDFANTTGLKKNYYISYGNGVTFSDSTDFKFSLLADLTGNPTFWSIVSGDVDGLHKGVVNKIDSKSIFFDNGTRCYKGEIIQYYQRLSNGRFEETKEAKLYDGTQIWYVYCDKEIRAVFFE